MMRLKQRLRQMPETLAALSCLLIFFGPLCILLAVLPLSEFWSYQGRTISYQQFWRSGGGILVTSAGAMMTLLGIGFYRAQRWVQYAIPFLFIALSIYSLFRPDDSTTYERLGFLVWGILSYWYLNRRRKVVEYFTQRNRGHKGYC
jgi:hypothetical protein